MTGNNFVGLKALVAMLMVCWVASGIIACTKYDNLTLPKKSPESITSVSIAYSSCLVSYLSDKHSLSRDGEKATFVVVGNVMGKSISKNYFVCSVSSQYIIYDGGTEPSQTLLVDDFFTLRSEPAFDLQRISKQDFVVAFYEEGF